MKLKDKLSIISKSPLIPGNVGFGTYKFFRKHTEIRNIANSLERGSYKNNFIEKLNKYKLTYIGLMAGISTEAISFAPLIKSLNYVEHHQKYMALAATSWAVILRFGINNLFKGMNNNLEKIIDHHNN